MEIFEVYGGMLVCGMLMLICWYGDRYWKCGCFCQFFGKSHKWTKKKQ
jgi:hypothetical protein